jgi:hypothetical protein
VCLQKNDLTSLMKCKYLDNMKPFTGNTEIMILKRRGGIYLAPLPPFDDDLNGITCYRLLLLPACPIPRRNDFALVSAIKSKRTLFKNPRHTSHANTSTVYATAAFKTRAHQKKLIYKNADKTSKLVPLQTQSFATHKTTFTSCLGLSTQHYVTHKDSDDFS